MNFQRLVSVGLRAATRAVVDDVPDEVLSGVGLRRGRPPHPAAALFGAFALGAVAGAGLLLLYAPGASEVRKAAASRLRHLRNVVIDAEVDVEDGLVTVRDRAKAIVSGQGGGNGSRGTSDSPAAG